MKFQISERGWPNARLIDRVEGDLITLHGVALMMKPGSWGAFSITGVRLTERAFKTPAQVRKWFEEQARGER